MGPTCSDVADQFDRTLSIGAAASWSVQGAMSRAVHMEAAAYSEQLGLEPPHTDTTMKPAGSVSKLFGLSEGAHLPSMLRYLRWVQFREDDPQIEKYRAEGYPIRELVDYRGHVIVRFPTEPLITTLEGIEDHIVTAGEATMEDQFVWLRLLEAFWIEGNDVASYVSGNALLPAHGNQVSYTMKYRPDVTSLEMFADVINSQQRTVRCVSVMPQEDTSAYEYLCLILV
jgi:ribonucleoside-triphosphate reductase (formate)